MAPHPASLPAPLPPTLLPELARQRPLLLCLDYDGTLAEITTDPRAAYPLEPARAALAEMAGRPERVRLAVVSGRGVTEVRRLLGIGRGVIVCGVHGLEMTGPDGRVEVLAAARAAAADLERVRAWLSCHVPAGAGFLIEDKKIAVALHYRTADRTRAGPLRRAFAAFLWRATPSLCAGFGKMVIEAIPRGANKGHAVRAILKRSGPSLLPVYFGDDQTDEDGFRAVGQEGIAVLVGRQRKSAARYRLGSPRALAHVLGDIAQALRPAAEPEAAQSSSALAGASPRPLARPTPAIARRARRRRRRAR